MKPTQRTYTDTETGDKFRLHINNEGNIYKSFNIMKTLYFKRIDKINRTITKLKILLIYVFLMMVFVAIEHVKIAFAMVIIPLIALSIWAVYLYSKEVFKY